MLPEADWVPWGQDRLVCVEFRGPRIRAQGWSSPAQLDVLLGRRVGCRSISTCSDAAAASLPPAFPGPSSQGEVAGLVVLRGDCHCRVLLIARETEEDATMKAL